MHLDAKNIKIYILANLLLSSHVHFINVLKEIARSIFISDMEFNLTVHSTFVLFVRTLNNNFFQILKASLFSFLHPDKSLNILSSSSQS